MLGLAEMIKKREKLVKEIEEQKDVLKHNELALYGTERCIRGILDKHMEILAIQIQEELQERGLSVVVRGYNIKGFNQNLQFSIEFALVCRFRSYERTQNVFIGLVLSHPDFQRESQALSALYAVPFVFSARFAKTDAT